MEPAWFQRGIKEGTYIRMECTFLNKDGAGTTVRSAESQKTNDTSIVMGIVSTVCDIISTPRRDGEWQTKINRRTL